MGWLEIFGGASTELFSFSPRGGLSAVFGEWIQFLYLYFHGFRVVYDVCEGLLEVMELGRM